MFRLFLQLCLATDELVHMLKSTPAYSYRPFLTQTNYKLRIAKIAELSPKKISVNFLTFFLHVYELLILSQDISILASAWCAVFRLQLTAISLFVCFAICLVNKVDFQVTIISLTISQLTVYMDATVDSQRRGLNRGRLRLLLHKLSHSTLSATQFCYLLIIWLGAT